MMRKSTINKNFLHEIINQTNVNYQLNTKNELSIGENDFGAFWMRDLLDLKINLEVE